MVDAEIVVYSSKCQKPSNQICDGIRRKAKGSSKTSNSSLTMNQNFEVQTRARQNHNRKTKGVLYNISLNWLTRNRHRINDQHYDG